MSLHPLIIHLYFLKIWRSLISPLDKRIIEQPISKPHPLYYKEKEDQFRKNSPASRAAKVKIMRNNPQEFQAIKQRQVLSHWTIQQHCVKCIIKSWKLFALRTNLFCVLIVSYHKYIKRIK